MKINEISCVTVLVGKDEETGLWHYHTSKNWSPYTFATAGNAREYAAKVLPWYTRVKDTNALTDIIRIIGKPLLFTFEAIDLHTKNHITVTASNFYAAEAKARVQLDKRLQKKEDYTSELGELVLIEVKDKYLCPRKKPAPKRRKKELSCY